MLLETATEEPKAFVDTMRALQVKSASTLPDPPGLLVDSPGHFKMLSDFSCKKVKNIGPLAGLSGGHRSRGCMRTACIGA